MLRWQIARAAAGECGGCGAGSGGDGGAAADGGGGGAGGGVWAEFVFVGSAGEWEDITGDVDAAGAGRGIVDSALHLRRKQYHSVYDPQCHEAVPLAAKAQASIDQRWVRVRRPAVVAGGEMTIAELDLTYSPTRRFYEAPMHVKANGGMLFLDDLGRQRVNPTELLNRWIVPLEQQIDYLTLASGFSIRHHSSVANRGDEPFDGGRPGVFAADGVWDSDGEAGRDALCGDFRRYVRRVGLSRDESVIAGLIGQLITWSGGSCGLVSLGI